VITPLERAMLRPFASVVMPVRDEKRLGGGGAPQPLLTDVQAQALGVPTIATRRNAETLAFAQLLRLPRITLAAAPRRRWRAARAQPFARTAGARHAPRGPPAGRRDPTAPAGDDPGAARAHRHAVAADLLPPSLSASACEALARCPYRFFALRLLQLREADELDEDAEKSDYGSWLQPVLHRFHAERAEPRAPRRRGAPACRRRSTVQREMHLEDPSFLPYCRELRAHRAALRRVVHARRPPGRRWSRRRSDLSAHPLRGAASRCRAASTASTGCPAARRSSSTTRPVRPSKLRKRVAETLEDTQLASTRRWLRSRSTRPRRWRPCTCRWTTARRSRPSSMKASQRPHSASSTSSAASWRACAAARRCPPSAMATPAPTAPHAASCRRDHWAAEEAPR
jgi:ATP-dependent helicase/nuclease subunit B